MKKEKSVLQMAAEVMGIAVSASAIDPKEALIQEIENLRVAAYELVKVAREKKMDAAVAQMKFLPNHLVEHKGRIYKVLDMACPKADICYLIERLGPDGKDTIGLAGMVKEKDIQRRVHLADCEWDGNLQEWKLKQQ